jgi:RNA polymerase sigma-70 factor (ECF subfamily)
VTKETVERRMTPDADLVARMVTKDGAALDELWARHSRTAYAVAIGILRESARADQAVSEAFLEAFSVANQFIPGELTVLAWLTRLTRRHAEAMIVTAA